MTEVMFNQQLAVCPVKGGSVPLGHCEQVHANWMQGMAAQIEDDLCYIARACLKCPFRQAVKPMGGAWSLPGGVPKSAESGKPVHFPDKAIADAAMQTMPNSSEYNRRYLKLGIFDENFRRLGSVTPIAAVSQVSERRARRGHEPTPVYDDKSEGSAWDRGRPVAAPVERPNDDFFIDASSAMSMALRAGATAPAPAPVSAPVSVSVSAPVSVSVSAPDPAPKKSVAPNLAAKIVEPKIAISEPTIGRPSLAERAKAMQDRRNKGTI
jgi:hypothetical protein